ncbi:MAG TPA: sigma 54-interacting transcriptional regulator, partial [Kofleriaceae bacterium]|nr:sigma 54-interacting transcriptional regulator [Kofleriaceae bacterium]
LPPALDDEGEPCGCDEDCATTLREALREPGEAWAVLAPHARVREIAAPVVVRGEVVGALLAGTPGLIDGDPAADDLSRGEISLFGDLLAEAAREVAGRARNPAATTTATAGAAAPLRRAYDGLIGRSPAMQSLYTTLDRVARSDATVLIQGENGTGKELVARAIHEGSARAARPFVITNCSAFNDNLLDSELFGHKRGSFTGAVSDKPGLFEIADTGTFFLDEIGDMSPALQVKVLRVIQEGTFNPVGDTETRRVDVRLIAATNRDLRAMVAAGQFREDLYYRIHVINLVLPALRERGEDIALLVEHFLGRHRRGGRVKRLTEACAARLAAYPWPGNVRELENEIERAVVLSGDDEVIDEDLLSPRIRHHHPHAAEPAPATPALDDRSLPQALESLERSMILDALRRHHGNKTRAAAELKVSRRNLIRLCQKYALDDARG